MERRPEAIQRARDLRRRMTPAEVVLWQAVRASRLGYKIRRQHPFGPYVIDFYCAAAKLAIEVDGGVHETEPQSSHDHSRDQYLIRHGVRTLRVSSALVMGDPERVIAKLKLWIERAVEFQKNGGVTSRWNGVREEAVIYVSARTFDAPSPSLRL
ncbi:MAG TPA: DUF559 domain-containing protein [Caulobacteraceae bacterium]|jgi:very-short-patch-repair endonuclease